MSKASCRILNKKTLTYEQIHHRIVRQLHFILFDFYQIFGVLFRISCLSGPLETMVIGVSMCFSMKSM